MITTFKCNTLKSTTSRMSGRGRGHGFFSRRAATSKPQTAGMSAKELQEMVRRAREEVAARKVSKTSSAWSATLGDTT